jgi:tetraacyldisaccharide 4'-kinase
MPSQTGSGISRITRLWRDDLTWRDLLLWAPLAPLAAFYGAATTVRREWWRLFSRRATVATISVGNLTVGGNAKTPFALFLAKRLAARGIRVGIVSRGYGAANPPAVAAIVAKDGKILLTADEAGDEPIMIARAYGGPVAVGRRRLDAIALLERLGAIDAIVLDDGFQHLRLRRDVDLLVVGGDRALGNGWILPAGPLREPTRAARRADAIILMAVDGERSAPSPPLARMLARAHQPVFHARLEPASLIRPELGQWHETPLALHNRRILAVSGLADPSGFYRMLRRLEADLVGVLEFPDHHRYTGSDWHAIRDAARDADAVITTEKDLVKLERFPFARNSLYALRIEVVMDAGDEARLLAMVARAISIPTRVART